MGPTHPTSPTIGALRNAINDTSTRLEEVESLLAAAELAVCSATLDEEQKKLIIQAIRRIVIDLISGLDEHI